MATQTAQTTQTTQTAQTAQTAQPLKQQQATNGYVSLSSLPPLPKRAIVCSSGKTKCSKTDWSLRTAPEPITYLCLDPSGWAVAHKLAAGGRDIRGKFVKHQQAGIANQAVYVKEWGELKTAWYEALDVGIGTLVVDSGTEFWEACRLAHFGKVESVRSRYYGPLHAEMKVLFRDLHASSLSANIIHKLGDEWQDDKPTGGVYVKGWGEIDTEVQSNVELWRDDTVLAEWARRGKPGTGWLDEPSGQWKFPFHVFVKDYTLDMGLSGQDFTTDLMGFGQLVEMGAS